MNLERLRAVQKAATNPGPWTVRMQRYGGCIVQQGNRIKEGPDVAEVTMESDGTFIAVFNPELVGKLLDMIEEQIRVLRELNVPKYKAFVEAFDQCQHVKPGDFDAMEKLSILSAARKALEDA